MSGLNLPMSDAPQTGAGADRPGLVRAIGRWSLTAAIVNGVIGSGIFGMPGDLARHAGSWSPLVALIAGLGVLAIVLCFAEVASRFREPGGPYLYAREAFGREVGYQAGWLTFWIRITAAAANLNLFVVYLAGLVPAAGTKTGRAVVMVAVLGLITAVNVFGVRQATWAVNLFTLGKLLPLALLIVLGLPRVDGDILATQTVARADWHQAVLLLMFAYGGFEAPLIPAGEARDPRRDTGFALLTALAVISAVYLLVQLVVVGIVPAVGATGADGDVLDERPIATALGLLLGGAGASLASIAAMVSIWGYTTGSVLQGPRVAFSMAERGELPRTLARVHPRFRTPDAAIVTYSALVLTLALTWDFTFNAVLSAIIRLLTYGLTCAAVPVLRRRSGDAPGFRIPAAWLVAPLGAGFCLWLLSTRSFTQAWIIVAMMAAGWAVRWAVGAARRGAPARARG
jgi:amino acid transporter